MKISEMVKAQENMIEELERRITRAEKEITKGLDCIRSIGETAKDAAKGTVLESVKAKTERFLVNSKIKVS